jgi:hypothetical protein
VLASPRDDAALCGDLRALRRAIGHALRRGDTAAIADGYLALASALTLLRRFACAARELREGIDILTAGCDVQSCTQEAVDRLGLALAALYDRAGEQQLARSAATPTDDRPTCQCAVE